MPVTNVRPNGDSTPLQWVPGDPIVSLHYLEINEGTNLGGGSPNDNDYLETQTANNAEQLELGNTPANASVVTQVDINFRGWIDDSEGETDSYIQLDLFHSSGTAVTGNPKTINSTDLGGQRVIDEVTRSWTGLSLTQVEADSLEVRMTLVDPS